MYKYCMCVGRNPSRNSLRISCCCEFIARHLNVLLNYCKRKLKMAKRVKRKQINIKECCTVSLYYLAFFFLFSLAWSVQRKTMAKQLHYILPNG